ncbi:MAG TPA: glycosyltransferase family 39 protein [Burkholderiales bacterium]|nr:glycosyltransferase family 39 protein [Burkholderiales bacterium]
MKPGQPADTGAEAGWQRICLGVAAVSILLRLLYLGVPELLFEEAYYWNYAQHLDIGYLDHPLMVAWIIRAFTGLLGNSEFAVRTGAFLCWLVTAWFVCRLTFEIFGRAAAYRALVLVAALPAYFFIGFFMSPDAPLAACWAAAIYFMHRIAAEKDPRAWLWLGVALGLGMSSKYTISLLAAAITLFVLVDRESRRWLRRPEPYVGALITLALFSPAIVWNWQQDWASFSFQSHDRLAGNFSFSLPRFLGNVIALLTPTGVLSVIALVAYRKQLAAGPSGRSYLLLAWLTLFPVAVFAAVSLFRVSKLNWTGPAWLGLVPFLALLVSPGLQSGAPRLLTWCRRAWPPTIAICLLFYGATLQWLGPGLPGVPYSRDAQFVGWREFARDIEGVVQRSERDTGREILVVGMDRNRIASELAYYRTMSPEAAGGAAGRAPAFNTASENLFGSSGLMYALWFPAPRQNGKAMLLVSKDASSLGSARVLSRVKTAGKIEEIDVRKNGKPAGRYYVRLVTGYQATTASGTADAGREK